MIILSDKLENRNVNWNFEIRFYEFSVFALVT